MRKLTSIRRRMITTTSLATLGAAIGLGLSAPASAQGTPPAKSATLEDTVSEVVVVGTRASLQSAIERKRRAGTNVDSIVAEDVSQFPDKNIGEALSRVTGVQLTRDLGEGAQVSIRGVEPDLNRVEINGLSVLNNTGVADGGTGARGANFQELASELVASIDVFKGFTADMTEGGVGGTVSIKTRKPLDLKKPLLSISLSDQYLDIMESQKFRGNITAGRKFFDGRLGVLVNFTYDDNDTRGDSIRNTEWNRFNTTATTSGDYDNSPEKTWTNPLYASANTKQDCPTGTGSAALACLQQWDDNVPRIPRYTLWWRNDKRISGTGTLQYRFNNNLTAFVEATINKRDQFLVDNNYVVDASAQSRLNAITYDRNGNALLTAGTGLPVNQTADVDENHNVIGFWTANRSSTGSSATLNTVGASATSGAANIFTVENRQFDFTYKSEYYSGGFEWRGERLSVDALFGRATAKNSSNSNFVSWRASIPNIRVDLSDEGVPSFTFPSAYDPSNPATYAIFANNGSGVNYTTTAAQITYRPSETDTTEDTIKIDLDYRSPLPFFTKFEAGYQYRSSDTLQYSGGGRTIRTIDPVTGRATNPIVVQGANINHNLNIDPRATTSGSAVYNYLSQPATLTSTLTAARMLELITGNSWRTPSNFFAGSGYDPGVSLPSGWFGPNIASLLGAGITDLSLYNHDNLRSSPGRDAAGNIVGIYDQIPSYDVTEEVNAAYAQTHWATEVFGRDLTGNIGVRHVQTQTSASGALTERQIIANPAGGANITEDIGTTLVTINRKYSDWLPSFNAQLLITDKLVGRFGAAKVMARPKIADIRPNATCTYDRTPTGISDQELDDCSAGNPALEPYRANQFDVTIGYFADRDTLFNASYFYKDVKSFILPSTLRQGVDLFGNGNLYDVTQPINGTGAKIHGLELSAQTAFSFLPAPWDGFGGIVNYTYSKAKNVGLFNALTGEELPFPGLSKNSYNLIVYYDKGPINARVAYNYRDGYLLSAAERSGNPVFRDATGYLDARMAYKFGKNLTAFIEGRNLTGEVERTTSGDIRMGQVTWAGKRYFIGFTWKM